MSAAASVLLKRRIALLSAEQQQSLKDNWPVVESGKRSAISDDWPLVAVRKLHERIDRFGVDYPLTHGCSFVLREVYGRMKGSTFDALEAEAKAAGVRHLDHISHTEHDWLLAQLARSAGEDAYPSKSQSRASASPAVIPITKSA